jgi:hypothetical protein
MTQNWSLGLPDDYFGPLSENCMHMWQNEGEWNDLSCLSTLQATMCEKIVTLIIHF